MNLEFATQIVSIVNMVGLVFGALYLAVNRAAKEKEAQVNQLDRELVENLKDNISALERKSVDFQDKAKYLQQQLDKSKEDHQISMNEIARLTGENATMKSILEGKDALTKEFYEKSIQSMKRDEETYKKFDTFIEEFHIFRGSVEGFIGEAIKFRNNVEKLTLERRKNKVKRLVD